NNTPVTEETIDGILLQMGFPLEDEAKPITPPPYNKEERRIAHRLYRNPQGAMLGGVCTGLATYFNIDLVLVRLAFVILPILTILIHIFTDYYYLSFNFSILLLYLAGWIIIPKARTPRQMLEMRGEGVTKENIENFLREEMSEMENNIGRITRSERSASIFSSVLCTLGNIIKIIFYIIGILLVVGICFGIIASILVVSNFVLNEYPEYIIGDSILNTVAGIMICIIPLIMILLGLVKIIFKANIKAPIYYILFTIWLTATVYGTVIAIKSNQYVNKIELNYFK
ncbi:MAG: PspC domain-containing protein, partial [Rikenellaceae bacterium]